MRHCFKILLAILLLTTQLVWANSGPVNIGGLTVTPQNSSSDVPNSMAAGQTGTYHYQITNPHGAMYQYKITNTSSTATAEFVADSGVNACIPDGAVHNLPAGNSCTFSVSVTAASSATPSTTYPVMTLATSTARSGISWGVTYSVLQAIHATLSVTGDLFTNAPGTNVGTVTIINQSTTTSYSATVTADADQPFPNSSTEIELGTYTVTAPATVTVGETTYYLQTVPPVVISPTSTNITIEYDENTPPTPGKVPAGWDPNKISMPTLYDGSSSAIAAMGTRPAVGAFTYAGQDGGGDRGVVVPFASSKIPNTIGDLTNPQYNDYQTMPIFVVYTANASGGGTEGALPDIENAGYLNDHYQTLIIYAQGLEAAFINNDVRSTVILNPDFIGSIGKDKIIFPTTVLPINDSGSGPTDQYTIQQVLDMALTAQGISIQVPANLFTSSTLVDYIQSINWVMGTFAPDIPYGWEDADWAGDTNANLWLHEANTDPAGAAAVVSAHVATETAFLQALGVFTPIPVTTRDGRNTDTFSQFLAFDQYGANPIFNGNYTFVTAGYLFNKPDWDNYVSFTTQVAKNLDAPLMLFQIPGAHLPDNVDTNPYYNLASFPNYIFGSNTINFANFAGIPGEINAPGSSAYAAPYFVETPTNPGTYLSVPSQSVWQTNRLNTLHNDRVFAILWGGGGFATGIWPEAGDTFDDNGWLYNLITSNSTYVSQPQKTVPPDPQTLPIFPYNKSGAQYAYLIGDKVTGNAQKLCAYQCMVASWCNNTTGVYAPGTGVAWGSAWALLSPVSGNCPAPTKRN